MGQLWVTRARSANALGENDHRNYGNHSEKNDNSAPTNVDDGGILLGFYVAEFVASFVAAHLQDFRAFIQCGSRIGHQDLYLLRHTEVTKRRTRSV